MLASSRSFLRFPLICATVLLAATVVPPLACSRLTSPAAGVAPISAPSSGLKKVQIRDPNMNNMVAYTLEIPANWNFQGAVLTAPGCGAPPTTVAYRVWSDDLHYGVQRMPEVSWFTPSDPRVVTAKNCKKMDALSAMQYAGMVMPTLRPNSTLIATSAPPQAADMNQFIKKETEQSASGASMYHLSPSTFGYDGKELRIQYNLGSQLEEEYLQVLERTSDDPTSIIVSQPGQRLRMASVDNKTTVAWIIAERAPKGQLDAARSRLEAIRISLTVNPEWDRAVADRIRQQGMAAIQQGWTMFNAGYKASQDAANARLQQGQAFISNMQQQGDKRNADFAAYEDSRTRHTADQVDAILDRQYYVNPSNGTTSTISTTYTNNWQNGTGDSVLTNIQNYDPNGTVQGNWTQLQPIKH